MSVGILTDLTKCIGCEACVWACKDINELSREDGGKKLSDKTWTTIERHGTVNVRRHCMHCLEPSCASVCPVAALQKSPEGAVIYLADRCIGCRYCMIGCPFNVPKYEWDKPIPYVQKCILCYDKKVSKGEQPACTAICPTGATIFGDREELIEVARGRLRGNPGKYVDAIYGLKEAGGTSVMYLSAVPFEDLGFKTKIQMDPYPQLTWRIVSKIPSILSVTGTLLIGMWWVIRRRQMLNGGHEDEHGGGQSSQDSGSGKGN